MDTRGCHIHPGFHLYADPYSAHPFEKLFPSNKLHSHSEKHITFAYQFSDLGCTYRPKQFLFAERETWKVLSRGLYWATVAAQHDSSMEEVSHFLFKYKGLFLKDY